MQDNIFKNENANIILEIYFSIDFYIFFHHFINDFYNI
jgi:hypothetical protein